MNNPKTPFHSKSHYDFNGDIPFQSGLPNEEEDHRTLEEARAWLAERGGGTVERCCNSCGHWSHVETVAPTEPNRAVIHGSRRVKRS